MNYSKSVFLINQHARAIATIYEAEAASPSHTQPKRTSFKTLDPDIKVGDFVIVPTTTRHSMTVVKVVEVDVDVDFDTPEIMQWIIGVVDRSDYEKVVAQESTAISTIKSAELRQKREALRDSVFKDKAESLKTLAIADMNGNGKPADPPTS